jgi:hypothetical protein
MAVALTALFVALGGTGYAASVLSKNSVGTKQLKDGAVTSQKLHDNAVGTANLKAGAVTGAKMNLAGVTVPNAVNAISATNSANASHASTADNATNAAELGGVPAASIYQPCGSNATDGQDGTVKGKAVIVGLGLGSDFSTAGVSSGFVCTGQHVQVKSLETGAYEVVFGDRPIDNVVGIPAVGGDDLVMVTSQTPGLVASASGPYQCNLSPPPSIECFSVELSDLTGLLKDGTFSIALL